MKYFQSDDIPSCESKGDHIHTYYRIVVDDKIIKEGRHSLKQTKNIKNRTIYKRKWNESKRCWKDDDWQLIVKY
jgi:hypothetical protein